VTCRQKGFSKYIGNYKSKGGIKQETQKVTASHKRWMKLGPQKGFLLGTGEGKKQDTEKGYLKPLYWGG
jgi:hypothetical protein